MLTSYNMVVSAMKAVVSAVSSSPRKKNTTKNTHLTDVSFLFEEPCGNGFEDAQNLMNLFVTNYRSELKRKLRDEFNVPSRFWIEGIVGSGAYGSVAAAYDVKKSKYVAIKKTEYRVGKNYSAKRELSVLKHLRNHPNFVNLQHYVVDDLDLYLISNLAAADVFTLIHDKTYNLTKEAVQSLTYQLLLAVNYMHQAGLVHLDLKPTNLLVDNDLKLQVCDFGLSRAVTDNGKATCYVTTRNYRAPELLLDNPKYGTEVDMWSVGCIFAELLGRKILFDAETSLEVIEQIVGIVGTPRPDEIVGSSFLTEHINTVIKLKLYERRDLNDLLPNAGDEAMDLLTKMLTFNPKNRFTAEEALQHPYFANLFNSSDIIAPRKYVQM
jgi:serine/threonine protein kinase